MKSIGKQGMLTEKEVRRIVREELRRRDSQEELWNRKVRSAIKHLRALHPTCDGVRSPQKHSYPH